MSNSQNPTAPPTGGSHLPRAHPSSFEMCRTVPVATRGAGDGERNRLFAESYGQDPEFFAFYRSMTAYENGLKSNDTRFLLPPDSEFFRFFANPSGKPPAAKPQ